MPRGVSGCYMIIILQGSSVSESTVCGRGAYAISDADSRGIGTQGLPSDQWHRVMPNRIDSLTDGDSRNLNAVTIAELCVNRTEACTTKLSGYIYTGFFFNCDLGVRVFSLCGSALKYRIPISGILPLSERIRSIRANRLLARNAFDILHLPQFFLVNVGDWFISRPRVLPIPDRQLGHTQATRLAPPSPRLSCETEYCLCRKTCVSRERHGRIQQAGVGRESRGGKRRLNSFRCPVVRVTSECLGKGLSTWCAPGFYAECFYGPTPNVTTLRGVPTWCVFLQRSASIAPSRDLVWCWRRAERCPLRAFYAVDCWIHGPSVSVRPVLCLKIRRSRQHGCFPCAPAATSSPLHHSAPSRGQPKRYGDRGSWCHINGFWLAFVSKIPWAWATGVQPTFGGLDWRLTPLRRQLRCWWRRSGGPLRAPTPSWRRSCACGSRKTTKPSSWWRCRVSQASRARIAASEAHLERKATHCFSHDRPGGEFLASPTCALCHDRAE